MKPLLSRAGEWLVEFWLRVMGATVDEGIGWQSRRPPILKAAVVILFAVIWMAIGFVVSGVAGRLLARRDRRLN